MTEKRNVLLADDEEMVRNVAKAMLIHLGFDVILATDGQEALGLFLSRQNEISLVILDISMPGLDGFECLKHIRRNSDVPALIATGYGTAINEEALLETNAQGILPKPFTLEILAATIHNILP